MQRMIDTFKKSITATRAKKLVTMKKDIVSGALFISGEYRGAGGGAEQQVLDNIIRYASPELSTILMAKYKTHRHDLFVHAEKLA